MQPPQPGFYRHYKHDPTGPLNNYTYEVIGIARHTEERTFTVLYRPLYENEWLKPANYCARPLEMFNESVEKDGKIIPRFELITDSDVISSLKEVSDRMYDK